MGNKKRSKNIRLNGINPLAYMGVNPYTPPGFYLFQRDPTVNDIHNFIIGDLWLNTQSDPPVAPEIDNLWMLVSLTQGVATWVQFGGGDVESLSGDSGTNPVFPDGAGNINVFGDNVVGLTVSGDGINTLTVTTTSTNHILETLTGDTGGPVPGDAAGNINTLGDTAQQFIQVNGTPGTNTLEWRIIQPNTDAGLLIGNTAANSPLVGDLVSPDGSILIAYAVPNIQLRTLGDPTSNFSNFGMTIAAGVITIHSADGSAFSATNRGIIEFPSKVNPGFRVRIIVTANVSMNFTDMDGNDMGTAPGIAWSTNPLPLYLYAVINDAENTCTFGWGRVPNHVNSGTTIGTPASATANDNLSLFLFQSITIAQFDDNPVVCMGAVRVTKDAADSWTFLAIDPGNDGINCYHETVSFFMEPGQNGAPAGQIMYSNPLNSTTPIPNPAPDELEYVLYRNGYALADYRAFQIGVAGVGTGNVPDTSVYAMLPIRGRDASGAQGARGAGCFCSGPIDAGGVGGVFTAFNIQMPDFGGRYSAIHFTQLENTRLYAGDFNVVGQPWIRGAISFLVLANA